MRYSSLFLILVLATTANATISLYINGAPAPATYYMEVGETPTIQIYSSDNSNWGGLLTRDLAEVGNLSNPWVNTTPGPGYGGDSGIITPLSTGEGYEMTATGIALGPQAGIQFSVDYSSYETGSALISLWDNRIGYDPGDEADTLSIIVVPEPCTILLLGLGGLVILKKHGR